MLSLTNVGLGDGKNLRWGLEPFEEQKNMVRSRIL
jgi:hypothetical protein